MSERAERRRGVRIAVTAARLGITAAQWQAMTRAERKAAKHAARPRPEGARREQ